MKVVVTGILLVMGLGGDPAWSAPLFKYIDAEGDPVLSSHPELRYPAEFNRRRFYKYILQASILTKLKPSLLEAVVRNESNWHVQAVSEKGALGLMQLMPGTAKNWGVSDPFNAQQNIFGGASYLKYLLSLFDNDLPLALAAYHAGENRVIRAKGIPQIKATRSYVNAVLRTYARLETGLN